MQPAIFLSELERALSPTDVPLVLAALKQDELVWSTLQQPGYVRSILSADNTSISEWTPARLALKPLGSRVRLAELACDHLPGIEGSLRKQSLELLEKTIRTGAAPQSLTEAGLIALALRERRRKMQSWKGIYGALVSMQTKSNQQLYEVWRTPLACLFTIIPDGKDLLAALLPADALHPAMEWITHILLANPMDPESRVESFGELFDRIGPEVQVEWLSHLKRMGQSSLAGNLAERVLAASGSAFEIGKDEFRPEHADMVELSSKALSHQIAATLHQFAGHPLQTSLHLEKVRGLLQHWLVGSTIQQMSVSDREDSASGAIAEDLSRMLKQFPIHENLAAESLFAVGSRSASFSLSDSDVATTPLLAKLDQARQLARSGSRRQAQEIAYVAVHNWMKQVEKDPSMLSGQFIFELNPKPILEDLVELGLYADAISVGEKFLAVRPEDLKLMTRLGDLCHRIGDDEKAVNLLYQVALFEPGQPDTLRKLAAIYEDRKEWTDALDLRQRVLGIVPLPAIDDQLTLAHCAYGAQKYDDVRQTCEKILAIEPDQGIAYTYLGMACQAEGDLEAGLVNLNKATLLIPENPLPWIQLAEVHKKRGEIQRALETLRAAVITAPDSAELHYAVGQTCLEAGLTSEALPFLRQAAKLAPESDRVGLALAETLLKLGHEADALTVIEKTRVIWPAHARLAYLHARILLDKNETDRGLSVLEIALQGDDADPAWFILYARTLIGEFERNLAVDDEGHDINILIKAHKVIQKAVSIAPESFEARLLLAEILSLRGEHEAAYAAYMQIVELPEAESPDMNWRVQAGLGRTALALGQTETALASLKSAVSSNPESISLQRSLAETYRQANLLEAAQTTAQAALELAPDEIGNLLWFAEFMDSIGAVDEAVESFQLARQINPDRVDLAIKLAEALLKKGDPAQAHLVLEEAEAKELISAHELRRIAQVYLSIGDHQAAVASMEKAVAARPDNSDNFQYELAVLYAKAGDLDKSLDAIQKAIREDPGKVDYYLFLSEVQERNNRPQAALASLEHVMRLIGVKNAGGEEESYNQRAGEPSGTLWQKSACNLAEIHMRFAKLLQKVENLGSALYHAEKALDEAPGNYESRCMAVELAMKLLQYDRAEKLAELPASGDTGNQGTPGASYENPYWAGYLYSLRAELALARKDYPAAAMEVESGSRISADHPRLLAVEIRLLAREGEYQEGDERFISLRQTLETDAAHKAQPVSSETGRPSGLDLAYLLASAAVDLRRWNEALELFESYTNANPFEPQGMLLYAAALVKSAEWSLATAELSVSAHPAPESALAESSYGKFTQLISELKKISNAADIDTWKARGEVVFHPTSGGIRSLAGLQADSQDVSLLIQAMERIGDIQGARKLGEQYFDDPEVNLQLSLLKMLDQAAFSLERAQAAVAGDPKDPILHVAAARAYEMNGDYENALDSLKIALFYWNDEAFWHDWAGSMAERCGQYVDACAHYEQALEIIPSAKEVAHKLGRAYLKVGRITPAVEVFERAVKEDPQNSELWLNLAEAQFAAGNHTDALVSAETSARLNPASSSAKVLCGEISLAQGEESRALNMVRDALTLDPRNIRARLLSSRILVKKGKEKEALAEINKAIESLPEAVELQIEKAHLTYRLYGPVESLKVVLPALQKHPDHDQLLALQAKACAESGDLAQAEIAALHTLRINPAQADMQRLLGGLYQQTGQLDKALHHMSEAVRLDPENVEIYLDLGEIYASRREYDQALKTYQLAMKAAPEDYRPFYRSALVLRDGKDYPGAESMMRRAAQLAPNDVNIRRQLGAIVALNLVQSCQEANTCQ